MTPDDQKTITLVTDDDARAADVEDNDDPAAPAVGRWFWVKGERKGKKHRWLGCVTSLGSNYATLTSIVESSRRIHFDEFLDTCEREPHASKIARDNVASYQNEIVRLMHEAREVTARLAVAPTLALRDGAESTALALAGTESPANYKAALVLAKEKTLPGIFDAIKEANESLAQWMTAELIPMKAEAKALEPAIERIEDRIFSVELYAGLVETVELVRDGEPAEPTEPIRLMQRRCYMDEECLARYETGGMEFKDIHAFDRWLVRRENMERILPFSRCVVAFQVRRHQKERDHGGNIGNFIQMQDLATLDKLTFLYLRNGERLYRLSTGVAFDAQLFPEKLSDAAAPGKRYFLRAFSTMEIITDAEYQGMTEEWDKEKEDRRWRLGSDREPSRWTPFTPESVYYDDVVAHLRKQAEAHSRLVLVLQGLLDRSPVFHPHPPWSLWNQASFEQAVTLIYDDARALTTGDAPDFEAYRIACNASLRAASVTIGQDGVWARAEAEKEGKRRLDGYHREEYRPSGNPGPGYLARIVALRGKAPNRAASYAWTRERGWRSGEGEAPRCVISCPEDHLFNVDAYKPGDFRRFFDDPRTRADYMEWAPLLLAAEEYHAGNRTIVTPAPVRPRKPPTRHGKMLYALRKECEALVGKVVRLARDVKMRNGTTHKKGSLWRVVSREARSIRIEGALATGITDPEHRAISSLRPSDVIVDEAVATDGAP